MQDDRFHPSGAVLGTELAHARALLAEAAQGSSLPVALRAALRTIERALAGADARGVALDGALERAGQGERLADSDEVEAGSSGESGQQQAAARAIAEAEANNPFALPPELHDAGAGWSAPDAGLDPPDWSTGVETAEQLAERLVAERRAAQSAVHAWADELRRARARLFDAIDSLDAGFLMFGPDERLIVCNRRYKELYPDVAPFMEPGATLAEISQRWVAASGGKGDDGAEGRGWLSRRLAEHRSAPGQSEEFARGRWIRTSDRRTQDGGVVSLRTDITSLKRQGDELRRARDAAEAASRAKSEFLANMSHEIRTPMNGVLGMTELLLDTALSAEQREYLRLIKSSAHNLLAVINDVLDLSKIEAGRMTLEQTDFSLADTLEGELRSLAVRAEQKGLRFQFGSGSDVPDGLLGDPIRLRQILINLLGNAIKFTDRGEVSLEVARVPDPSAEEIRLRFAVRDTGIGIAPEQQRAIFEAFAQADNSTTRRFGGTGLGLTISARLVEQMGGKLEVQSAPGQGSTFSFVIPLGAGRPLRKARSSEQLQALGTPPLRVLVAEDQSVNRFYVRRLLEKLGHQVTLAIDGEAAVQTCLAGDFDVLLMDVQMPRLSGLEATRAIRAHERRSGRHTPIWALTAHALLGDEEKCLAAGMDGYLTKPLERGALQDALAQVAHGRGGASLLSNGASPDQAGAQRPVPDGRPAYDAQAALEALGGDRQLIRELAQLGVVELPALVAKVRAASAQPRERQAAAHALKGAAANLSLPRLADAAQTLEHQLAEEQLTPLLDALDAELALAIAALLGIARGELA